MVMAASVKIFVQIVMILAVLGLTSPDAACAVGSSPAAKSGCCGGGMTCKCPHDKTGNTSCKIAQLPSSDKSIPAKSVSARVARTIAALYAIVPVHARDSVCLLVFSRPRVNDSPPFGGSSPQAVLRLWRI